MHLLRLSICEAGRGSQQQLLSTMAVVFAHAATVPTPMSKLMNCPFVLASFVMAKHYYLFFARFPCKLKIVVEIKELIQMYK